MQPVEIVEQVEVAAAAQQAGDAQESEQFQPEIVGGIIINRRVDEQDPGCHVRPWSGRAMKLSRRDFTAGHSSAMMLYITVSRMKPSCSRRCWRSTPSRTAP